MSKQIKAKIAQGYVDKVVPMTCSNCANCVPVMGERLSYIDPTCYAKGTHMALIEVGQKCGVGGFKVKKLGYCNLHSLKGPK